MSLPPLLVTLTDAADRDLQRRLPLVGLIEVLETNDRGHVVAATFREQATAGRPAPTPVVVDQPVFTYGLVPNPDFRGWAVSCGCDGHGDHAACTKACRNWGCVHPKGVMVTAMTEAEADARSGEPVAETDPWFRVRGSKVDAALAARPALAAHESRDDLVAFLSDLRIGVKP